MRVAIITAAKREKATQLLIWRGIIVSLSYFSCTDPAGGTTTYHHNLYLSCTCTWTCTCKPWVHFLRAVCECEDHTSLNRSCLENTPRVHLDRTAPLLAVRAYSNRSTNSTSLLHRSNAVSFQAVRTTADRILAQISAATSFQLHSG